MAKKATKVLRPTGASAAAVLESAPKVTDVPLRPEVDGGEVNFEGADVLQQATKYVDLEDQIADAEEAVNKLKAKQAKIEEWLLDQMQTNQTQSLKAKKRTIFIRKDLIVSKAKGITTDQVNEKLREFGLGDLIAEGYNANTLKATVREMEEKAKEAGFFVDLEYLETLPAEDREEAGAKRFAYRCSACGEFYEAASGEPMKGATCSKEHDAAPCYHVENGVPLLLRGLLYIAIKPKLSCVKS